MWKQVRSVHERSLVTGALIHAYLPSAGRAVGGSGKALSPRSPPLMTVFMLTHTGRVPSFQLLISFGHRRRPEISLPLYHFFTSLQKSSRGRRYKLPSPGQACHGLIQPHFSPLPRSTPVGTATGWASCHRRVPHACSYRPHHHRYFGIRDATARFGLNARSRFNELELLREGSPGSWAFCRNKAAEVG